MNQKYRRSVLATSSVAVVAMFLASQVRAAEADSASATAVSEVIVSAQKRSENLQQVPVAVTAITGAALAEKNIVSVDDLRFSVPGFQAYSESPGIINYSIRGLGNENSRGATADGSVGIFLNEVYIGRPYLVNNNFLDVDHVEVLRGPQGTLFGRNTIGGAISFFGIAPTSQPKAAADITIGNYDAIGASGYVIGPIADNLSAKLSATLKSHDGYDLNTTTNTRVDDERYVGLSGALRYQPTDSLDATLNVDTSHRRGNGGWWILSQPCIVTCATSGMNQPGHPYADPRAGNAPADNGFGNTDNTGGSLNVKWSVPVGVVTSITSYRDGVLNSRTPSVGGAPEPIGFTLGAANAVSGSWPLSDILYTQEDDYKTRQYSQELRVSSPDGQKLSWIVGGFYFHENSTHHAVYDFQYNLYYSSVGETRFDSTGSTDSYAGFANVGYNLTDDLKIQLGVRYSQDHKTTTEAPSGKSYSSPFTINGVTVPGQATANGPYFNASAAQSFSGTTPSGTISYQVTPDIFTYATVSQGFKSGGFNDEATELVAAETPFKNEHVTNSEIGAKTEWLDHRLRLNVSAFYLQYSNLQVAELIPNPAPGGGPNLTVYGNAGKSHNTGVEAEFEFRPVAGLDIYGNYAYQKARIDELVTAAGVSEAGYPFPFAPVNKYTIGASYTANVQTFDLTGRVSYSYTDPYASAITIAPGSVNPSQSTIDGSLLLSPQGRNWGLELWGKNLANKLNSTDVFAIFNSQYQRVGAPRTFGVTVHLKY